MHVGVSDVSIEIGSDDRHGKPAHEIALFTEQPPELVQRITEQGGQDRGAQRMPQPQHGGDPVIRKDDAVIHPDRCFRLQ